MRSVAERRRIVAPLVLRLYGRAGLRVDEPVYLRWSEAGRLERAEVLCTELTMLVEHAELVDLNGYVVAISIRRGDEGAPLPVLSCNSIILHGKAPASVMGPAIDIAAAWAPFVVPCPCEPDESGRRCARHGLPLYPVRDICAEGAAIARSYMSRPVI